MISVSISVLKNSLGKYVRLAAHGETVLITNPGRVVAELMPPRSHNPVVPYEHTQELDRDRENAGC